MAVAAYDTQLGATLTLGTDSLSLRIISITPLRENFTSIRTTHLGTSGKHTWIVGELADYDEVTVTVQNSPGLANPSTAAQTITITGPTASGATTPESVTGTAFIRQRDFIPGFSSENEALQTKTFVIKYDGGTGPTRTVSS